MYNKRVRVMGGIVERPSTDEKEEARPAIFNVKREVVVEERNIAALMRRDPELCAMHIKVVETNDALTPGYLFSELQ